MDFHGSYKAAVKNLSDAHRLHKKEFPAALGRNQTWASERMEGPNIANVFKLQDRIRKAIPTLVVE